MRTTIGVAALGELTELLELLSECGLPREGVAEHLDGFLVAREDGALRGVVGLESYGDVALLRSLAVRPAARGKGWGGKLVQSLMEVAQERNIRTLYLLTETAEGFFPRFGFERIPRDRMDARLEASRELQGVCPESAVAMRLDLSHLRAGAS